METETPSYILRECKALDEQRVPSLGETFHGT
jgi:hypothetical protein